MKKFLILALLALASISVFGQSDCTQNGLCAGVGAPTTSCTPSWIYTDAVGGGVYKCVASPAAWELINGGSSGTITGVTAGTGITGGGTTGTIPVAVNMAIIPSLAGNNNFTASNNFTGPTTVPNPTFSYTQITSFGDSITSGVGGGGTTFCAVAATLASLSGGCNNEGYGAQTSTQIAERMGAIPVTVTVTGNSIPASGGVTLTCSPVCPANSTTPVLGTIAGIQGNMTFPAGTAIFTRSVAGSVTPVTAASPWTPVLGTWLNNALVTIMGGNNDYGKNTASQIISNYAAMVAVAVANNDPYIVLAPNCLDSPDCWGQNSQQGQFFDVIDQALAATYGNNFIDVKDLVVAQYNPSILADVLSYGRDTWPQSLRANYGTADGTLVANIADTTSCSFTSTTPVDVTNHNTAFIDSEQILILTSTGGVVNTCIRGYNGTTATTHTAGAQVTIVDCVHLNSTGYTFVGNLIYQWMLANPSPGFGNVASYQSVAMANAANRSYNGAAFGFTAPLRTYSLIQTANSSENTGYGAGAMEQVLAGVYSGSVRNTGFGYAAGYSVTTGHDETLLGANAGWQVTTGFGNTMVGSGAGSSTKTANGSTFIGSAAGQSATAQNDAFGYHSLGADTSGANNVAIANSSGAGITTGNGNTYVGFQSGVTATAANQNVSGSNNVAIGINSGPGTATQLSNTIAIGNATTVSASNQAAIGNAATAQFLEYGTLYGVPTTGHLPAASTGTINARSTDNFGTVTAISGATTLTITYGNGFQNFSACTVSSSVAGAATPGVSSTTTALTIAFLPAYTGTISYTCGGN